jgi:phage/plasmid-associated DNA primase
MSVPKFITFTIPSIETYINKQGIEKKKPIGMPKDWTNKITKDNYEKYNNDEKHLVKCLLTGSKSGITVIDFDNKKSYDKICKELPEIKKYRTIKTRRGFHIYCNYNSNILTTTDGLVNYNNVDIANDKHMVFCPPTFYYDISGNIVEYEDLGGDIMEVPSIIINDLKQNQIKEVEPSLPIATFIPQSVCSSITDKNTLNNDDIEKNYNIIKTCLDNGLLNQRANMDYDAWMKVGFAIRHSTNKSKKGYELWLQFSKINEEKFEEKETKHLWNKTKDKFDNPITIGSLIKWAKDCNLELYNSLFSKSYYISLEDLQDVFKVADIITKTLNTTLIFCQEKWYMLNSNNLWKQQKEPSYYITREIRKYIDFSNKQISIRLEQTQDEDTRKQLIKYSQQYLRSYQTISTSSFINVVTKYLKTKLIDNNFSNKLDSTPNVLAFKNGIMDLRTKIFREGILSTDFITETIPYDYQPCNPKKKEYLKNDVLKKILNNNDEHLEYYLSIIGFSFIGSPQLEKSIYFMIDKTLHGKGDNGKTIWYDILNTLMPNYVYRSKAALIEKNNTKVHKQLVMTKGKRLVWLEELPKDKQTNAEFMKEIADGKQLENEIMFGTSETLNIQFKIFILSNHVPNIDPNESAVYNRYKQVSFNSHFDRTGQRTEEDPKNLLFIADSSLGDKIKNEYYNEVFDLIIEYANNYYEKKIPKIPQQFIKDTNDTKTTNDTFAVWFNDNCIIDSTYKIALKQLISGSCMTEKLVKDGMSRLGFKYNKDLSGLEKDSFGKYYKGGFEGIKLIINDEEDVEDED